MPDRVERRVHVLEVVSVPPSIGELAAYKAGAGTLALQVPRFPKGCVCCNVSDAPYRYPYELSVDDVRVEPIELPVCIDCREHGFVSAQQSHTPFFTLFMGSLLGLLPWLFPGELPGSVRAVGMAPGMVLFALGLWLRRRVRRRIDQLCRDGHHGDLELSAGTRSLTIMTSNPKLAEGLRRLNDNIRGG